MRYTVGIRDSNPLARNVCPGARLTTTNVSLPNHVYRSYTDVRAGPEHSSVPFDKVDPVRHAKDLGITMANTYVPTNYSTDVLAGSTRSRAARAHIDPAHCAKGFSEPMDNFGTSKHHNYPNDPIHSGNILAPSWFPQYSTANWSNQVLPVFWTAGNKLVDECGVKFSGKSASDYPAYRHRFNTRYHELRYVRPDLLLRWLENTIEGQAKRFIQDVFAVIDPGKACDVIWENLEEVYGKKDMIIENAIQQIKRPLKSIDHNRKALLELRADLRNLKGVAVSVGLESKLKAPQILGKLYSTLSDKLRNKFDVQYPANKWSFDQFIEFLSLEITHVDSLHLMKVDSNDNTQHRGIRIRIYLFSRHFEKKNT